MYKIGEFAIFAKTTIKTLRYYEKEKLLKPFFVDNNGYRYYETSQLSDLIRIISLRQMGFSIKEIKDVFRGSNFEEILKTRRISLEDKITECKKQLLKINYILEEKKMDYEIIEKELPDYIVYYKEGVIENFAAISSFVLSSSTECLEVNPTIKCVEPSYCFINYLDGEYKETNINIRYAQAVIEAGVESETIKFMRLKPLTAVCICHKGSYAGLRQAYSFVLKYIKENGYEIVDSLRECYIDGIWNKENEEDWLTEIQVPVKKS